MGAYPIDFTLSAAAASRATATYPDSTSGDTKWRKFKREHVPGGEAPSSRGDMGVQAFRISPVFSVTGETATLQVAIVDTTDLTTSPVVFAWTIACTAGAIRNGLDGASGGFMGAAVDAITGRDTFDLLGHLRAGTELYIGMTTAPATGTLRVRLAPTRDA